MHSIYAVFAVILPVSLGLGLVYLSSIGRIGIETALMGTILLVVVMGGGVAMRDAAERRDLEPEAELEDDGR